MDFTATVLHPVENAETSIDSIHCTIGILLVFVLISLICYAEEYDEDTAREREGSFCVAPKCI